jgi:hypothetical protein
MTTLSDMPDLVALSDSCDCVCAPSDCPYTADSDAETVTCESHRAGGILAGDFIKPDPALTQRETRIYILKELQRWLTGRICQDAKDIGDEDLELYLQDGTWPAARLYAVLQLLEKDNSYILPPTDKMDRFLFVGQWAVSVCADYLNGYEPGIPAAILATGFVTHDTLPCGRTIESFWDHTPFEPLREAPPLSTDDQIDASTSFYYKLLTSNITVPAWLVVAAVGGVAAYVTVRR